MKTHTKIVYILISVFIAALSGCGLQPETTLELEIKTEIIIRPTETERAWVTIAPDYAATLSPTPTMHPINIQLKGRIAFQSDRDGSLEIYVMNADGTAVSRLTNNPAVDVFPAWSPDGDQIAFTSDREGFPDIYLVNPDGTDLRRLTNSPSSDVMPAWSYDGNQIAFVSNRDGNDEIYLLSVVSNNETRLTNDSSADYFPSWSPNGEWLTFTSMRDINPEIYKMSSDGSEIIRLTNDPADDSNSVWSPDGSRIAFTSNRSGYYELFVMNTDGTAVIQITDFRSLMDEPSWSPDSGAIAFASNKEGGQKDIYIISANGSGLNRLTDQPTEDFYPAWSPLISFLDVPVIAPTPAPEGVCVNSDQADYGFSAEKPIRIGYDPRGSHETEFAQAETGNCLPWILGPQGQPIQTSVLEEVRVNDTLLCKVAVSYAGQDTLDVMYFDIFNYEQPKAPQGYTCGSPVEYLRSITAAIY